MKSILLIVTFILTSMPTLSVAINQDGEFSFYTGQCDDYVKDYVSGYLGDYKNNPDDFKSRVKINYYISGYVSAFNRYVWNGVKGIAGERSLSDMAEWVSWWCAENPLEVTLTAMEQMILEFCREDHGLSVIDCQGLGDADIRTRLIGLEKSKPIQPKSTPQISTQSESLTTKQCYFKDELLPLIFVEYMVGVSVKARECDARFGGNNSAEFVEVFRLYKDIINEWESKLDKVPKRFGMTQKEYNQYINNTVKSLARDNQNLFTKEKCAVLPGLLKGFKEKWTNLLAEPIVLYSVAEEHYSICD